MAVGDFHRDQLIARIQRNETYTVVGRNPNTTSGWYQIRLRVTRERIQVWIDEEKTIDLDRANRRFDVWYEQEPARPFGFSTWETTGALRNIRVRYLSS